jgi:hypothetical protein
MKDLGFFERFRVADPISGEFSHDEKSGFFQMKFGEKLFFIVVNEIDGWQHVIVSSAQKEPSWKEMCYFRDKFFELDETVIQFCKSPTRKIKNTCELWSPAPNFELPNLRFFQNRGTEISKNAIVFIKDDYYKLTYCNAQGFEYVTVKGEKRPSNDIITKVKNKIIGNKIAFQILNTSTEKGIVAKLYAPTAEHLNLPTVLQEKPICDPHGEREERKAQI